MPAVEFLKELLQYREILGTMNEQLLLFEEPPSSFPVYNLVLAVFPDHYTAQQISAFGSLLRKKHGLYGQGRPTSHLHVSLPLPRRIMRVPKTAIEAICRVCTAVAAVTRPFEIEFDQVKSFQGKDENHPLVLLNNNHGSDGIMRLHGRLSAEFARYLSPTPKFVPHLTLLYDNRQLTFKLDEPVCWKVKEVVLVNSEVGATKYHPLGRWVFGG